VKVRDTGRDLYVEIGYREVVWWGKAESGVCEKGLGPLVFSL